MHGTNSQVLSKQKVSCDPGKSHPCFLATVTMRPCGDVFCPQSQLWRRMIMTGVLALGANLRS